MNISPKFYELALERDSRHRPTGGMNAFYYGPESDTVVHVLKNLWYSIRSLYIKIPYLMIHRF